MLKDDVLGLRPPALGFAVPSSGYLAHTDRRLRHCVLSPRRETENRYSGPTSHALLEITSFKRHFRESSAKRITPFYIGNLSHKI